MRPLLLTLSLLAGASAGADQATEITYLGHSGWLVKSDQALLLFDYVAEDATAAAALRATLEANAAVPLIVLVTHEHADHYNPSAVAALSTRANTRLVFGWAGAFPPGAVTIAPGQHADVAGVRIMSVASTDAGSAFAVQAGRLGMFHAGDHALWTDAQLPLYEASLRAVKAAMTKIDIAFLPAAAGNAACTQRETLIRGGVIAATLLQPSVVVPMHARCVDRRTEVFDAFAAAIRRAHPGMRTITANQAGFRYQLPE